MFESAPLRLAQFNAILESTEDAISTEDSSGVIQTWNPAACAMFGYAAEEVIGTPANRLAPIGRADEEAEILRRLSLGERVDRLETQRVTKAGQLIDVSLSISPIRDGDGTIIGACRIARDNSMKTQLAYMSAIVESADDAIIGKNLNGIITSWNRGAQLMYGYTADEMIGKPVALLIPSGHLNEEAEILARLRRGERIDHYETRRVCKDGRTIDVSLTISPIRNKNGEIIGASKIARDITDRKRIEARERLALEKAEAANRSKDEFLATVSHELRTPLTAILGWTRMLSTGSLDEESKNRAIEVIDRNVRMQTQLVEDLLDISRIISGKLRLDVRHVDAAELIRASLDVIRPGADAKGVHIRVAIDPDVGPISGDFQRLQQIVWNLLSNAVKFTPRDGVIRVEVRRVRSHLEITVSDTGIGIKAEFLPLVFNRFSQADSSITRTHGGLGVGLAISRSLVELHGGSISVASDGEGTGATFTVKLPVAPLRPPHQPIGSVDELGRPQALNGLKILVVDDEEDTCDMLQFLLQRAGALTQTALNAGDALEIIDTWKPDLLISDIGMPNVDGYELIKRVRASGARNLRLPAVALTALARIEDRVKALAAGYHMHIAKPVEPDELLSVVASLAALGKQAT